MSQATSPAVCGRKRLEKVAMATAAWSSGLVAKVPSLQIRR